MNRDFYKKELSTLCDSGVGVILTRTTEPHRAQKAIMEYGIAEMFAVKVWTIRDGWREYDSKGELSVGDNTRDPIQALLKIQDIQSGGRLPWKDTLCVMVWPHKAIQESLIMLDCLRQYAWEFPESTTKLILITPEGFSLPQELAHDVPIIDFPLPSKDELLTVLDNTLASAPRAIPTFTQSDKEQIAGIGTGMTEVEYETAVSKSITLSDAAWNAKECKEFFVRTIGQYKSEVIKRGDLLEIIQPESMDNVGGFDILKDWISKRSAAFSEEARAAGVDAPKGILCIGPPRTGKSLIAKAIASSLNLPLLRFDLGRVFGSLVGQSEQRMRQVINQLRAIGQAVVLLDEIDKSGLDPRAGSGDSGVAKRVLEKLLTEMQEGKSGIFWVLTANRHDAIPPELIGKGRLDEIFSVLPPTPIEREQILKIHLRKRNHQLDDLEDAVRVSDGYVGAELEAAVNSATLTAFLAKRKILAQDIVEELQGMIPLTKAFPEDAERMRAWAAAHARPSTTPTEGRQRRIRLAKA